MITIERVFKTFQTGALGSVVALGGIDVEIGDGEFFVLLGPSGSGKTTLMRCVAGLETPDSGVIRIGDDLVFSGIGKISMPPERRGVGMVFQSYAIWPHMTVWQNVALPLTRGKMRVPQGEVVHKVDRALTLVGMQDLGARPAPLLSGGQQQRVALARALAVEPRVLLMDEPLSNLDARLREEVRAEIKSVVEDLGVTVLYVTHDQTEAMDLANRIAVMHMGNIVQIGSAEELYANPKNPLVAQFFGEMNWLEAEIADGLTVKTQIGTLHVQASDATQRGGQVLVGIRPERIQMAEVASAFDGASENVFSCDIASSSFLGDHCKYWLAVGDKHLMVKHASVPRLSGTVSVRIPKEGILCFPGEQPPVENEPVTGSQVTT